MTTTRTAPSPDRSALQEVSVLAVCLVVVALLLAQSGWLSRWDLFIYDMGLSVSSRVPHDDIIIVAIDEYSLGKLGRWPWSRRVHAQLVERLAAESSSAIGLDIILAEPDTADPAGDQVLALALAKSERTVLPVLAEPSRVGGPLIETFPLPVFRSSAAALGHIHVHVDPDAIVRGVFLVEGPHGADLPIGEPGEARWPTLPVAMLRIAQPGQWDELPGRRHPGTVHPADASGTWKRDHQVLIPFAGPPGHFRRISYSKVLEGEYPPELFQDKLVLVGATAAGLGDWLPTPVSGSQRPMPGIEFSANVLDALLAGIMIHPVADHWRYAITGLLVVVVPLCYPFLSPRSGLVVTGLGVLGSLGLSTGLLLAAHIWLPLAPAVLAIALGYPLWSWRRLEYAMRFLRRESTSLRREQARLQVAGLRPIDGSLRFLAEMLPVRGWVIRDEDGVRSSWGEPPAPPPNPPRRAAWSHHGDQSWTAVHDGGRFGHLGIRWHDSASQAVGFREMLDQIVRLHGADSPQNPTGPIEVVQAQIAQVQEAARILRAMRETLDTSLAQMTDGIVVTNGLGHIVFANAKAVRYFASDASTGLADRSVVDLADRLEIRGAAEWTHVVRDVLVNGVPMQLNGHDPNGRILLISVAPLMNGDGDTTGLIINTSDITSLKENEQRRAEMLGFLSHDLRSPLISVLTLLELARRQRLEGTASEMLEQVKTNAERALRLTDQFLALAQAEEIETLAREDVNLVDVATRAIDQTHAHAESKQIELQRRFAVAEAWTLGDPDLLERAVANLLTNAVKYSPARSTVRVSVDRDHGEIRCCVSDEGHGIAESDIPRIFARFERLPHGGSLQASGSGLGLAFVKAVVDRHGGRVEVASVVGKGSRFCLHLSESSPYASHGG